MKLLIRLRYTPVVFEYDFDGSPITEVNLALHHSSYATGQYSSCLLKVGIGKVNNMIPMILHLFLLVFLLIIIKYYTFEIELTLVVMQIPSFHV